MIIYLAARFDVNPEMRGIRDVLEGMGHVVSSRWIDLDPAVVGERGKTRADMNSDPRTCSIYAQADVSDLLEAETVIVFTVYGPSTTGGRDVEFGIALGLGKRVIVVGPYHNIFHTLPEVEHYGSWSLLAMMLAREAADA